MGQLESKVNFHQEKVGISTFSKIAHKILLQDASIGAIRISDACYNLKPVKQMYNKYHYFKDFLWNTILSHSWTNSSWKVIINH